MPTPNDGPATGTSEPPVTLLILGASGDLTSRLLLPGLASMMRAAAAGELAPRTVSVRGNGQVDLTADQWRERLRSVFDASGCPGPDAEQILADTSYLRADCTDPDVLHRLVADVPGRLVVYFALPPAVTVQVCRALRGLRLPDDTVLALEKPFGSDAASAARLNAELRRTVPEHRIVRADHFLGSPGPLSLLGLRFANRLFEGTWDAAAVAEVQIVYDETLALEGRAAFYDGTGAFVDMFQSHLLQVLALVAMDPPASARESDVRDQMAQVLQATTVWRGDPVTAAARARYTAGTAGGRRVPDYTAEQGVDPGRNTETWAEVLFEVHTDRWAGVPFRLRSGKALRASRTEIRLVGRPAEPLPGQQPTGEAGFLSVDIDTGELRMGIHSRGRGGPREVSRVELTAAPGARMTAYGEVLNAVVEHDALLSVRDDVAVRCWEIVEPVRRAFAEDRVPLQEYPAGSDGPAR